MDLEIKGYRGALADMLWGGMNRNDAVKRNFRVRLHNFKNGEYTDQWTLEVLHRPSGFHCGAQTTLNTPMLRQASDKIVAQGILEATLLTLAHQVAPRLYHLDPRIGTPFVRFVDGGMPSCPLFDRPDGAGRLQERALRSLHLRYDMDDVPQRCPFCRESLHFAHSGKAAAWAGGALCWVHKDCWEANTPAAAMFS